MARASFGPKPEKGGGCHFAPSFLDHADHQRFRRVEADRGLQLLQEKTVKIGAVAERRVEFSRKRLDLLIGHAETFPQTSGRRGAALTSAMPAADRGAVITSRAPPISTIRPWSMIATRCATVRTTPRSWVTNR